MKVTIVYNATMIKTKLMTSQANLNLDELIKGSLLAKFFKEKGNSYREPQKKGTPKGEPVGFSKTKYFASLLMITGAKQRDIAKGLNISYGLLRKWTAENPFKDLIDNHCKEFIDLFEQHFREKFGVFEKNRLKISSDEADKKKYLAKVGPEEDKFKKECDDAILSHYGDCLIKGLWGLLEKNFRILCVFDRMRASVEFKNLPPEEEYVNNYVANEAFYFVFIIRNILFKGGRIDDKEWADITQKGMSLLGSFHKDIMADSLREIKKLMAKKYLSKNDRSFILEAVSMTENYLIGNYHGTK